MFAGARIHGFYEDDIVARQIGRQPSIEFSVASSCQFGWPAVIMNSPYGSTGEPNPNLYYLTCPYLRSSIARLEDQGLIDELQSWLDGDADAAAAVCRAQESHRRDWTAAAGYGSRKFAIEPPRIAATGDDLLLKCLHAHLAYYLVHPDYQLGSRIAGRLESAWCPDNRCEVMMRGDD